MKTLVVEVIDDNAVKLLKDLELMQLIKLRVVNNVKDTIDWALKYKGKMTKQKIDDIDSQINEMRSEWE